MRYLEKENIMVMSLVDLEHCGFTYDQYEGELFLNGIDSEAARSPVMLAVNFTGGAIICHDTSHYTLERMTQDSNKFKEYVLRITAPGPFTRQFTDPVLLEKIASIEHDQWISWSKALALTEENLSKERRDRWRGYWKTRYSDLPKELKQQDRLWAGKVLETICLHMQNGESE